MSLQTDLRESASKTALAGVSSGNMERSRWGSCPAAPKKSNRSWFCGNGVRRAGLHRLMQNGFTNQMTARKDGRLVG